MIHQHDSDDAGQETAPTSSATAPREGWLGLVLTGVVLIGAAYGIKRVKRDGWTGASASTTLPSIFAEAPSRPSTEIPGEPGLSAAMAEARQAERHHYAVRRMDATLQAAKSMQDAVMKNLSRTAGSR